MFVSVSKNKSSAADRNLKQEMEKENETKNEFKEVISNGRRVSDRHEPISPVTTPLPMFPDSNKISPCSASHGPSRPVTAGLGPVLILYFPPRGNLPNVKGRMQKCAAGFYQL